MQSNENIVCRTLIPSYIGVVKPSDGWLWGQRGGGGRGNCLIWALSIPSHITGWYLNQHIVQNIITLTSLPTASFLQRMPCFIFVLAVTVYLLINLYMRHPVSRSENCWAIAYPSIMKTTSMDNSMNERSDECVAAVCLFNHFSYFWWLLSNLVIYILIKLSLRRLLLIGDRLWEHWSTVTIDASY